MGISHHWKRPTEFSEEEFAAAVNDFRRLVDLAPFELAGFEGIGSPILSPDHIEFNGVAPFFCEPFEVAQAEFDRLGCPEFYGHCKTQKFPYDKAVMTALIILSHHLGNSIAVSSDVSSNEWDAARELVEKHLGFGKQFVLSE